MKILQTVKKIPGGLMVVPLLIGSIINTFFPQIVGIGSFTTVMFTGAGTPMILAVTVFLIGTQLRVKEMGSALKRGGVLLLVKFLVGAIIGIVVNAICGPTGLFGISVLAIIAALTNSNGGLYMALTGDLGEPADVAAFSLLNINDGPFLTLLALSVGGIADIPVLSLVAALGPLIVGAILGNLDKDIKDFFAPGVGMVIPIFAFSLGATINLKAAAAAGPTGILLGVLTVIITGIPLVLADRYILKRPGYAGAAVASVAGNAAATPAIVAEATAGMPGGEIWAEVAETASAQIATAVVVTAILVPFFASWVAKKYGCVKNGMVQADGKPARGADTSKTSAPKLEAT